MRTGKDRVRLAATQEPITIGAVSIRPGDLVCGDEDGVVVVPAEQAHHVAEVAERIEAAETAIVAAVKAGVTLAEARSQHGYHVLQSSQS
jgi:4-hydroxy-4-methyl-2-oxoglutarate aldolase